MITHKGTQRMQTERLILRRFTVNDAEAMFNTWASDSRVTKYLTWTTHESAEVTKCVISEWERSYEEKNAYNWGIEIGGKLIGSIGVVYISEENEYAEIGYCIGYDYWNRAIMTEALSAVIAYLFKEVGFNRIELCHVSENDASGRLAKKCGMTCEGIKRKSYKNSSGDFWDITYWSILKEEWEEKAPMQ